jgi:ABC-2 type transport system permease protein
VNRALFGHLWRANRLRLLIVAVALAAWGSLMPVIYAAFGEQFEAMMESGLIPDELSTFGGGDIFSLAGSVALGFVHPIAVGLNLVFALGFAASAVAGERQRGTLEVLLARPISRRRIYATNAIAAALFVAVTVAALALGAVLGSAATGNVEELGAAQVPFVWLNGVLLFGAFAAIALAASVSFDRLAPAIGLSLAVVLVSYFLDVIGDLWPDAKGLQPFSLFHYFDARVALLGDPIWTDLAVLGTVIAVAVVYALVVFPRRDLAAPS